jgi:hypothetical protein
VAPFPANIELSGDADGHGLAGLIVGTYRADPNGNLGSLSTDRRRRVRSWIAGCAFLLAVASSPALAETGWSDEGWTVLTVARSGAWGLSTARTQGEAIAGALRQCQGRSADHSDCGAELIAYKVGWALAILCGDHRVMATADEWEAVEAIASERIAALGQIHGELPSCRHLLTVNPVGAVTAAKTPSR